MAEVILPIRALPKTLPQAKTQRPRTFLEKVETLEEPDRMEVGIHLMREVTQVVTVVGIVVEINSQGLSQVYLSSP